MFKHSHLVLGNYLANFKGIQSPLFKHAEDFTFAAFLRDQQHALLRLAQHDLVCIHTSLALRHFVHFDFETNPAASAHFAGGAGEACSAHVLNTDNGASLHSFEAGFEQQLFHEGITHLYVRALRFRTFVEFFAGHRRAVNTVASSFRTDVDHRISFTRRFRVEDFVFLH